jgi:hypothetical protein
MTEVYQTGTGYKIEIASGTASVFTIMDMSGQVLEQVQSINDLIAEKYIAPSAINEIKDVCSRIFNLEISQLQSAYFTYQGEDKFFSKFFQDITFSYKLNKQYPKEIQKKLIDDIRELITSKVVDKHLPISITDNKLEVMFTVSPVAFLKSFNMMYSKVMVDGNYSVINNALELISAVDLIHDISVGIMQIVDGYLQ